MVIQQSMATIASFYHGSAATPLANLLGEVHIQVHAHQPNTLILPDQENREVLYGAAVALAISGDSSQAQTLTNDLERSFPEDTSVKFNYLPTVRAFLALNHGDPAKAIELLEVAVPYEQGQPRSTQTGFFGALYPIYARGQAYLAAGQGAEAAGSHTEAPHCRVSAGNRTDSIARY